jgi:hypothetical protein
MWGATLAGAAPTLVAVQTHETADSDANEAVDVNDQAVPEAVDNRETTEAESLTPAERAAALERRAGEQGPSGPRGKAVVLGMHIQEGVDNRVKVVEVSAASPAFDAGVRAGDEIVSVDGFHAKTYREWIDGVRRMVGDTPDGETIAVELLRKGKRVGVQIRAPESHADDPRLPGLLGQPMPPGGPLPGGATPNQPFANQPLAPGGDLFINNIPFNDVFNSSTAGTTDRAMAEIVRLGEGQQANAVAGGQGAAPLPQPVNQQAQGSVEEATTFNQGAGQEGSTTAAPEGRLGVAGLRDQQSGMLVMLEVGGLAPGEYPVGIDDPALVGRRGQAASSDVGPNSTAEQPPVEQPAGGDEPNNSGERSRSDAINQTSPVSGPATPPTGQVGPAATPPTGQEIPALTPPTGRVDAAAAVGGDSGSTRSGILTHVGTLTIDQSGMGSLQQVVEGVLVRDVLGKAIVIYAPVEPPQAAVPVPPNAAGTGVDSAQTFGASPPQPGATSAPQAPGRRPRTIAGAQPQPENPRAPVAAGLIHMLSDRRPSTATASETPTIPAAEPQSAETGQAGRGGDPSSRPITR